MRHALPFIALIFRCTNNPFGAVVIPINPRFNKDFSTDGKIAKSVLSVIGDRLYCVVFTQRGDTMHVISLRKANSREVKHYADQN